MLLLRHGQSEWNAIRRWQGNADTPLTDLGRRQAALCAEALALRATTAGRVFGTVWSSTLGRAEETASIIAGHLDLGPVTTDDRWCEADAGEWEGLTPAEIERAYPGFLTEHRRPDTFESPGDVVDRACSVIHHIADVQRDVEGDVLVVTHSGLVRALVRHLGAPDERIPNLGGIWLDVTNDVTNDRLTGRTPDGSVIEGSAGTGIELHQRFGVEGIPITAVDAPGEDPGREPDQPDADGGAQR